MKNILTYKKGMNMKFFIKKSVMTENEKNIEKAFRDLQEWMLPLLKQWKQTRDLSDPQSKLLFEIRDMAKGIKKAVPSPAPQSNPKPHVYYMEMGPAALFDRLDGKRDLMTPEQRFGYSQLRRLYEADGHTGISFPWDGMDILRRLYGTYCFSRVGSKD